MDGPGLRRKVHKEFTAQGLYLDREGLELLAEYVSSVGGGEAVISQLLDAHDSDENSKITKSDATELINRLCGGSQDVDLIQVISAFEVPKIKYDPNRKAFYRDESTSTLHSLAEERHEVYLNRLYLLQQRLARNPLFNRPALGDLSTREFVELTEIKALLGVVGEVRTVVGAISQLEDGHYSIEDLSGSMPVDLSTAMTAAGFYIENCIVAAEGELQHNGIFKVGALGMPPNERRDESEAAAKGLDFFGGEPLKADDMLQALEWEAEHTEDRIIFVSDIWLDRLDTLARLDAILSGFESLDTVPSLFVLMGNFHSFPCHSASTKLGAIRENFSELAAMLASHTRIMESSRYIFVPGPGDPGPAAVLPRPALPAALTADMREMLPNAIFASNPCRVRYCTQQLIIFRDDLQRRMRRLSLRPPVEDDALSLGGESKSADLSDGDVMFEHLAMTITQQSHLCPVPLNMQAVYWELDHAMQLNPLPHVLVLADSCPAADFTERKSGCVCINPGSLHSDTFAAYSPSSHEAELCDVPEVDVRVAADGDMGVEAEGDVM